MKRTRPRPPVEISGEIAHVHTLSAEERAKRIAALRQELEQAVIDVAIEETQASEEVSDDSTGT